MDEGLTRFERVTIAAEQVRKAVKNRGANPGYHERVMQDIRRDAPVLWSAIDQLIRELEKSS